MATSTLHSAPKIEVHGHRGARTMLPENTVAGFRYAIEAGADFLELDLAVTKDNVLVVSHDPTLNRGICSAPAGMKQTIRELTLAEVRQWDCGTKKNTGFTKQQPVPGEKIPTFDEVLDLAPLGKAGFNIEIKSFPTKPELTPSPAEFAKLVLDAIRRHKLESRVLVQSFDFRPLVEMRKLASDIPLSALYDGKPLEFPDLAKTAGTGSVSVQYGLVTPERVRAAHAAGIRVLAWTANTPELWDKLIACGVDGIITDDPAALIAHLRAKALR
jgi:glycerophosphoryl diester phosphodiesterase